MIKIKVTESFYLKVLKFDLLLNHSSDFNGVKCVICRYNIILILKLYLINIKNNKLLLVFLEKIIDGWLWRDKYLVDIIHRNSVLGLSDYRTIARGIIPEVGLCPS
jgi:hypothetical protein